jgi:hypothetical protein
MNSFERTRDRASRLLSASNLYRTIVHCVPVATAQGPTRVSRGVASSHSGRYRCARRSPGRAGGEPCGERPRPTTGGWLVNGAYRSSRVGSERTATGAAMTRTLVSSLAAGALLSMLAGDTAGWWWRRHGHRLGLPDMWLLQWNPTDRAQRTVRSGIIRAHLHHVDARRQDRSVAGRCDPGAAERALSPWG